VLSTLYFLYCKKNAFRDWNPPGTKSSMTAREDNPNLTPPFFYHQDSYTTCKEIAGKRYRNILAELTLLKLATPEDRPTDVSIL
jgi:hypothetical protein